MEEIEERYVSQKVAGQLRQCGFGAEVRTYYQYDSETKEWEFREDDRWDNPNLWGNYYLSAPTHQMAVEWVREVCGYDIIPVVRYRNVFAGESPLKEYSYRIYNEDGEIEKSVKDWGKSYAKVINSALEYALEELII